MDKSPWGAGEPEPRRIARQLADRSLAQQEGDGLLLYDLQLDYIRAQYPDREALTLIHGAWRLSTHVITRIGETFHAHFSLGMRDGRSCASENPRASRRESFPLFRHEEIDRNLHSPFYSLMVSALVAVD